MQKDWGRSPRKLNWFFSADQVWSGVLGPFGYNYGIQGGFKLGMQYFTLKLSFLWVYTVFFQILVFCMISRGIFGYTGYMFFRYIVIPLTPWPACISGRFAHRSFSPCSTWEPFRRLPPDQTTKGDPDLFKLKALLQREGGWEKSNTTLEKWVLLQKLPV